MTNNKLTDDRIDEILETERKCWSPEVIAILVELQERRKAAEPELKPANLVNKFYERYPLASFSDDNFRAAALGYFMAGAELQCFGEFVKYEDLCFDE